MGGTKVVVYGLSTEGYAIGTVVLYLNIYTCTTKSVSQSMRFFFNNEVLNDEWH